MEISLIRNQPRSKDKPKVVIKYTIAYWNVLTKILKQLDMAMFGVKYLKKWTSVFFEIGLVFFLISCILTSNSFLVCYSFIFSDSEKLKNRIFSGFFNFEALYLEGCQSKSYKILLVCKKGFKICYNAKMKLISPVSPEIYPEKWQKGVTSIFAKTVLQNLKIFWFWTMGVLSFYICTFVSLE